MAERQNHVVAETRTQFGKGAARRARAAGKIPAVIYGHGTEPRHVELPGHEVSLIVRKANAIIDLDLDGKAELVLVKDVQKDPVRQIIEHIDLIIVKKGEKVEANVAVHVEGTPFSGTNVMVETPTVHISAEATHIPEFVVLNVEGAEAGTQFHASDLVLPQGVELLTDTGALIVHIVVPRAAASTGETAESAEGEAPAAEAAAAPAAEAAE